MALVLADRVRETSISTGTGAFTLAGAVTGYQAFTVIGNGNTTYYCIAGQGTSEWEVGIGTYTASGTSLARNTVLASSNGGALVPFSGGVKDVFVTYPSEKSVNYDASDNVGIGTTAPTNKLTVDGNANVTGNTTLGDASTDTVTVNGYMGVGGAGNAGYGINVVNTALTGSSQYGVVSGPTFTSAATNNATAIASVPATAAAAVTYGSVHGLRVFDATKGAGSTITSQYGILVADQTQGTNNFGITSLVSSGTNKWNIYASGTAQNYFAGNVGVGVTTPAYLLSLYGTTSQIQFTNVNTGTTATDGLTIGMGGASSTDAFINQRENANLIFNTNATERMRLDSAGNLGLGVTPSAWGATYKVLELTYGAFAGTSTNFALFANSYFDGTNSVYKTSSLASQYGQVGGTHRWYTAPSGTAGTSITWTQAMTLDASGRLLIGTTTSASATPGVAPPLQIAGTSDTTAAAGLYRWSASAAGAYFTFTKSRGTTVGTYNGIVSSGDALGTILWNGDAGTSGVQAASISAYVDGTPGTNDMPGRLVFSTTADGASTPTERMRITSAGDVGIGGTPSGDYKLQVFGDVAGTEVVATNGITINSSTITANATIPAGFNASSIGPITIASGVTVTVASGSRWVTL